MGKVYFTLTGTKHYYGNDFLKPGMMHIAKLNGRICGAKRSHSVSEQPNCYQSV